MRKTALVILGGFAGAGKTTISRKLSADHNFPLISTDEINDALRKSFQLDFKQASPHAYDLAWGLIGKYLENGVSVVLDTNMCHDRTWESVDALKREMPHVTILPFILECSLETHRQRIDRRGKIDNEHLNLGGDAFEDTLHKYDYLKRLNRSDLIRLHADAAIDEVYRRVLNACQDVRGL